MLVVIQLVVVSVRVPLCWWSGGRCNPVCVLVPRFVDCDSSISVAHVRRSSSALNDTSTMNTEDISSLDGMSVAKTSRCMPTLDDPSAVNIRDAVQLRQHLNGKQIGLNFRRE